MKVLKDIEPDEHEMAAMIKNQALVRESRFYAEDTATGKARLKAMKKVRGSLIETGFVLVPVITQTDAHTHTQTHTHLYQHTNTNGSTAEN